MPEDDEMFTPPPKMSEKPTAEELIEKYKWLQRCIGQIETKQEEMNNARATFLMEQRQVMKYLQENFPAKAGEIAQALVTRTGMVSRRRPDRVKGRPQLDKEVFAVIKAWPNQLSKEKVAIQVEEIYGRELDEVVDAMKRLFETGEINETQGRVNLGPGGI